MQITSRAQAIAAGTSAGALEIDLYREMGDEGREAAEQTAGRPWRSDSDGEAAAVLKVPQRWKPVFLRGIREVSAQGRSAVPRRNGRVGRSLDAFGRCFDHGALWSLVVGAEPRGERQ